MELNHASRLIRAEPTTGWLTERVTKTYSYILFRIVPRPDYVGLSMSVVWLWTTAVSSIGPVLCQAIVRATVRVCLCAYQILSMSSDGLVCACILQAEQVGFEPTWVLPQLP